MPSIDLTISDCRGQVVVALRELDVVDVEAVATARAAAADRGNVVIAGLAGLTFIDVGDMAALVRARRYARHLGGDLLLAAPQRPVLRVLDAAGRCLLRPCWRARAIGSMGGCAAVAVVVALPAT